MMDIVYQHVKKLRVVTPSVKTPVKNLSGGNQQKNDPQLLGKMAVETALGVLEGKKYPKFIDAGTQPITKDNAAQLVNDKLVFAAGK
ncbi:monosaccharide ABC transporter ATP-binding protein, CUT2 family [Desulforamulus reducens MI-1]|uniref:Monosaccharide ABC transporter ATP-binding protein, CUT2 family n=1 Tax=Desulforamulus reducens (strain ATCC BAA-1160 / DSM 100696 / MI-1) TaxID=349161 RepID=A4J3K9_DESRM|nr:hypothetical protein [Desulforamulus reducens]ABO49662.1 monosaccharide ABC transporter ATP-binding protein, CUT2 family [Desulforamulus reducens MI-1]